MSSLSSDVLCIVLVVTLGVMVQCRSLDKRESRSSPDVVMAQKRPFCNAFTGCGRKRSDPPNDEYLDKLTRKIMNEARLWELFQERLEDVAVVPDLFNNDIQTNTPVLDILNSANRKRRSIQENLPEAVTE